MKVKELIFNDKTKFIVITFITSAIGFVKSFVLLKIFNLGELGILTLAQTITTSVSLLQLGMITGGYRFYSYKSKNTLRGINSTVLMSFIILSCVLLFFGLITGLFFEVGLSLNYLLFFIIVAILSLYSNWVTCKLLATKNIEIVNKVQLWSTIFIFFITLSAVWFGFVVVVITMILMPVILIVASYYLVPELVPQVNFFIFKKYFKKILFIGFIPYLTSAITLLNTQLGRWIITFSLGTVILGRVYLVTLFVTLVNIFPNAVSNLFFPSIIEKYEKKMKTDLKGELKKYFITLGLYFIAIFIVTLVLIDFVVSTFLPKHLESISLIYAVMPSLLFIHLSVPSIIMFNAAKKFNYILAGSILMVVSYCVLVLLYLYFFKAKILDFFIIESLSAFLFFIFNYYYYTKLNKQNTNEKEPY